MPIFTIDTENNVTAYTSPDEAAKADANLPRFSSEAELAKLAADWPTSRLIDLWNSIPGNSNLTKLGPKAAARIWKALQPSLLPTRSTKAGEGRKAGQGCQGGEGNRQESAACSQGQESCCRQADETEEGSTAAKSGPRAGSKKAEIIALLQRAKGASLPEIQELAAGRSTRSGASSVSWAARAG